MIEKFKKMKSSSKWVVYSFLIAIFSFFIPWGKDLEAETYLNGFEVYPPTFMYILIFIYPLIKVFKDGFINKFVAIIIAMNGIFFAFLFIGRANSEISGTEVSSGPFVYIAAVIILIVSIFRFPKKKR
jgi:hypothetical protein